MGKTLRGLGFLFFFFSWEKVNQQMNVEALTGKACPDWSVEKKNMVITRQILQFQVYTTLMGQWGKNTAQLLKLSSPSAASNLRLSIICAVKVSKRWKQTKYGMRVQWLEDDCCGVTSV